jgi:hypothetical protein
VRELGYDRLETHSSDVSNGDGPAAFVCAYHAKGSLAALVFAREGAHIVAWSGLTGADIGVFADMADAIRTAVLRNADGETPSGAN